MLTGCSNADCSKSNKNSNLISNNTIEYNGIDKNFPINPTAFSQFNLNNTLCLPVGKPDISEVLRVDTKVTIERQKVIKTPKGTSLEGQTLTGYKLIAYGNISQTIIYIADDFGQSVNYVNFEESFCTFIVLSDNFNESVSIKIVPYLEDVKINYHNNRCFCECISIFLDTKFCVACNKNRDYNCLNSCAKSVGVSNDFPQNPLYFKQLILNDTLSISMMKPCIGDLISITSKVDIISTKLIYTENNKSLEGQVLSGCKLIIEYKIEDIVLYSSNQLTKSVYSDCCKSNLKSTFIIVPCEIDGIAIKDLLDACKLNINPYIEDICAVKADERCIYRSLNLFIDVASVC